MACLPEDQLQAYLDGALSFGESREIQNHLDNCVHCRAITASLKQDRDFVHDCLGSLGSEIAETRVNPRAAWSRFSLANQKRMNSPADKRGGFRLSKQMKRMAVAAVLVLCIGLSFTSSTVRAAAAELLTLFRAEKIQTVAIKPGDLEKLEKVFREKGASLNIENFGRVTNHGVGSPEAATLSEAKKLMGFTVLEPGYMPLENSSAKVFYTKPGSVDLELNVNNVNGLIKTLGGQTMLPEDLDGKTFTINLPGMVSQHYPDRLAANSEAGLTISQFKGPEINGPAGVDVNKIREAVLALPVIPDDVRQQLASISDWQKTLVIPAVDGDSEKVTIGDTEGVYMKTKTPEGLTPGMLVMEKSGVIVVVQGSLSRDELIKVAAGLK